ncbi:MAG: hypothetical protein CVV63_02020, partial [Tenericutes bacterium HGW-Tenericutes-8]
LSDYDYKIDQITQRTYLVEEFDILASNIIILKKDGTTVSLDQISPIIKGLSTSGMKTDKKLYYRSKHA